MHRAAGEALKTALTSDTTVVLKPTSIAGDGNDESFTAKMIVSEGDIAPDLPDVQDLCAGRGVRHGAGGEL